MASGVERTVCGAVKGTGSNLDVRTVGFRPKVVELLNITGLVKANWSESMADAAAMKQVTAGTISAITTGGVTPLSDGFRIGADTDINVSNEIIHWVARW